MSRAERFFFWLQRINAVGIFLILIVLAGSMAMETYRNYQYQQELEDEKFGNEVADQGPYSGDSIQTPSGEIAAYYQRDGESFERREGSDITLVNPSTGATRRIAEEEDAWVLNWEQIFRKGSDGTEAIGYIARITTEERYAAGKFDLVVGNYPGLDQKVLARDISGVDLPTIAGEAGAAFIMWSEPDKAAFVAVDLRDLSIIASQDIPMPVVRDNELSQGSGQPESLRSNAVEAAPLSQF